MADTTNDTFVAEDADGTPCLWLRTPGTGTPATPALLLTRDDVRAAVNLHKPNAHWGQASRDVHVDRLWDAIAATAGEADEMVCAECGYPMDQSDHTPGCGDEPKVDDEPVPTYPIPAGQDRTGYPAGSPYVEGTEGT